MYVFPNLTVVSDISIQFLQFVLCVCIYTSLDDIYHLIYLDSFKKCSGCGLLWRNFYLGSSSSCDGLPGA